MYESLRLRRAKSNDWASLPIHWSSMPGCAVQDGMDKYPLPAEPSYMKEIQQEVQGSEPPVFSEQGQASGKTRGRKPKAKSAPKAKASAKARARATGKNVEKAKAMVGASKAKSPKASKAKAAPKRKTTPKPKQKAVRGAASTASPSAASAPSRSPMPDASAPKRPRKPTDAAEEERIPPSHVTHNHIYASAYRKALAGNENNDKEFARKQAAAAVQHFKLRGTVNELCGQFRSKPRARKVATPSSADCTD